MSRKRNGGGFLFNDALEHLKLLSPDISVHVIVEIGTIRDIRPAARYTDGYSSLHWTQTNDRVFCVDNSGWSLRITKKLVGDCPNVSYHLEDGIEFLTSFDDEIDLLYIDGPDHDSGGQEFADKCVAVAPMRTKSIILIDDCDFDDDGKGKFAIITAMNLGFNLLCKGRQALMIRAI